MTFEIPSYWDKIFTIDDNLALIRNPNNLHQFSRYKSGDNMPPNASVGDRKLLPLNTRVKITDTKTDASRNVFVYAEPMNSAQFIPSGWTRPSNLAGNFLNETLGYMPDEWDLEPEGDNFTVIDKEAFLRKAPPSFDSLGTTIPFGSYVMVTARSRQTEPEAKYVRVNKLEITASNAIVGDSLGWTNSGNLVAGNSQVFKSVKWSNIKGTNAAWKRGEYIGAKILVALVGTGGQQQKVALETFEPYIKLVTAASRDNLLVSINSGFRTYSKQERLYQGWKNGEQGFNLAAKPGRSNHQNGIAFDLNTIGFSGTKLYDWLKQNATRFGFIRTVNREHWHWEYLPDTARALRHQGDYKLDRVVT